MPHAIRRLGAADTAVYRALRLRALREHPEAFTSSFEEESAKSPEWSRERLTPAATKPHDFFLGAFAGEGNSVLGGMVGLSGRYRAKERHNASVVGMYVAPELAGQGVGRDLMQALLAQARALPALEQLDLTVTAGNDAALNVYTRCGFSTYGTLPDAIKVGDRYYPKVHMVLRLHSGGGQALRCVAP